MLIRVCLIYNFVLKAKIGYILLLIQSKYLMLHIWHLSLAVNKHQALTQLMKYQCCGEERSHKTTGSWSCGADCLWQVMSLYNIQYKSLTVLKKTQMQPKPCLFSLLKNVTLISFYVGFYWQIYKKQKNSFLNDTCVMIKIQIIYF